MQADQQAHIRRIVCPQCGKPCANAHGYHSHWAQKHWKPWRTRPEPIEADLTAEQHQQLTSGAGNPQYR